MLYKKIIALLISVISLAIVVLPCSAFAEDDKIQNEIELLNYLKIITPYEDNDYHLNELVTRAQLSKMIYIIIMKNDNSPSGTGSVFSDVNKEYWAAGYIETLYNMGYISGYGGATFLPEQNVTYEEAAKMLSSALGYSFQADRAGGWLNGYMSIATDIGLLDNVDSEIGQKLTREQIAEMILNAMDVELVVVSFDGIRTVVKKSGETLLSSFEIEKLDGRVMANEKAGISGFSNVSRGQIQIDGIVYNCEYDVNTDNFLGKYVAGYIDTSDNMQKIIYFYETEYGEALSISDNNLISANNFQNAEEIPYIEYVDEKTDRVKVQRIDQKASIIKNGRMIGYASEVSDSEIVPECGTVQLLSDRNGNYDVVIITSYEYYVVDFADAFQNKISDKFGKKEIDLNNIERSNISYNGNTIGIESLNEWDVLAVMADNSDIGQAENVDIIMFNSVVSGTIEGISDTSIIISGNEYKKIDNILSFADIGLGAAGNFYIGMDDKIVAADLKPEGERYGMCLNMYYEPGGTLYLKIFSGDNKVKTYKCSNKLKVDSERVKDLAAFCEGNTLREHDGNFVRQLIKFETNKNDEVIELYTQNGGSIKKEASGLYAYCKKGAIGTNYRANDDTIAFFVPNDINAEDSEYEAFNLTSVAENFHTLDIYDVAEDYTTPCVVVVDEGDSFTTSYASRPIAVVKNIDDAVNDNGDLVKIIKVLMDGEYSTFLTEEGLDLVKSTPDGTKSLCEGDIILFETNTKGEIQRFYVCLDNEYSGNDYTETWFHPDSGIIKTDAPNSVLYTVNGRIKNILNNIMLVDINGVTKPYEIRNCMVYKYDSGKARNNLETGYAGDLYEGAHVFLRVYKSELKEVVIYDN